MNCGRPVCFREVPAANAARRQNYQACQARAMFSIGKSPVLLRWPNVAHGHSTIGHTDECKPRRFTIYPLVPLTCTVGYTATVAVRSIAKRCIVCVCV